MAFVVMLRRLHMDRSNGALTPLGFALRYTIYKSCWQGWLFTGNGLHKLHSETGSLRAATWYV